MTPSEKSLAAKFLQSCAIHYGDEHGCNDMDLPNTPENLSMVNSAELWNAQKSASDAFPIMLSEDGKLIYTHDFFIISYLAHLLLQNDT